MTAMLQPGAIRRDAMISIDDALVASRQFRAIASNEDAGRDDYIVRSAGIALEWYRTNPVVLFDHDPAKPIARCITAQTQGAELHVTVQFPDEGVSRTADEVYGLIRAGVLNALSIGFEVLDSQPLKRGTELLREITSSELMEISVVSIPALRSALITDRSAKSAAATRAAAFRQVFIQRGLYEVGHLACVLEELGWIQSCSEYEKELEGDGSKVPAMLGEALKSLGDALVAMTAEEVSELVAVVLPTAPDSSPDTEVIESAGAPAVKRFRLGRVESGRSRQRRRERNKVLRARMARLFQAETARN